MTRMFLLHFVKELAKLLFHKFLYYSALLIFQFNFFVLSTIYVSSCKMGCSRILVIYVLNKQNLGNTDIDTQLNNEETSSIL